MAKIVKIEMPGVRHRPDFSIARNNKEGPDNHYAAEQKKGGSQFGRRQHAVDRVAPKKPLM